MKLIIFTATHREAMPIISRLKNAEKITSGNLKGWQGILEKNIQAKFFCTGIGLKEINVPFDSNSIIINIGIAGSITDKFKIGEWIEISKVNNLNCNIVDKLKAATLVTVNQPVVNETEAKKLDADLVDMEGFAVAKFALKNNLQFYILKMVSDFAGENSSEEYKKSMELYNKSCLNNLQLLINNGIKTNAAK